MSSVDPTEEGESGPEPEPASVARKILLDLLSRRAHSRQELGDKLASRRVPDEVARRLLDRFEEVGLVDDDAYARAWVTSRQSGKGLSRRALAAELRRKGIDEEVAREALRLVDNDDEEEAARRLVRRKLRSLRGVDDVTRARRLVGALARKGYPADLAYAVVRDEVSRADRPVAQ